MIFFLKNITLNIQKLNNFFLMRSFIVFTSSLLNDTNTIPGIFQFSHKQEWNTLLITSVARNDIS